MKRPIVSVGVPVFNGERWLPATLESILTQTYASLEVVICDNASTDATEEISREFLRRDERIKYFKNPRNLGVFRNFNEAFRRSTGTYFRWNAASDLCHPQLVERCLAALLENPDAVLSYPQTRLFEDDLDDGALYECRLAVTQESPCERVAEVLANMGLNNIQSGLIRAGALSTSGLLPSHVGGDIVLVMELSIQGKFFAVQEPLFYRRMRSDTATALQSMKQILRYVDPERRSDKLQNWKFHRSRFAAVARSKLPPRSKACIYRHLARHFWWSRAELVEDLRSISHGDQ